MCGVLILLFTVVPTIELLLLIQIGKHIGTPATFGLVICTGVLGGAFARYEGWKTLTQIRRQLEQGQVPARKLVDGLLILIGGVLLITPGVVTDILGLGMILPGTRVIFRELLIRFMKNKIRHRYHLRVVEIAPENIVDVTPRSNDDDGEASANNRQLPPG